MKGRGLDDCGMRYGGLPASFFSFLSFLSFFSCRLVIAPPEVLVER